MFHELTFVMLPDVTRQNSPAPSITSGSVAATGESQGVGVVSSPDSVTVIEQVAV
jgi:allophanate hydrolase subunit 1